jgi:hypothetical protein
MTNVTVEALTASVHNAAGHEHRLAPIAQRAASIFAERLQERTIKLGERAFPISRIDSLTAAPVDCNLHVMSNEQAATAIALAWFDAVTQFRHL